MSNVIKLFYDAPAQLRAIADEMEQNPDYCQTATVIWGDKVFQAMDSKEPIGNASRETIFNCQFAISKLMTAAIGVEIMDGTDE